MALAIQPLAEAFAGEVSGIDCSKPLSPECVAAIEAGMDRHAVLVYRGQEFSDQEQLAFTLHFGEIERKGQGGFNRHIHFRSDDQARSLGRGIGDFSNIDGAGKPLPSDSRAHLFKLADRLWHSDSSFRAIPAKYSLLSGRAVPSWGGNTEFADMRAAYDALDERTRSEVEDLVAGPNVHGLDDLVHDIGVAVFHAGVLAVAGPLVEDVCCGVAHELDCVMRSMARSSSA